MQGPSPLKMDAPQLLPVAAEILEQVFDVLPIADIGRLQRTCRPSRVAAKDRRPWVLQRRGLEPRWPWRKAHAAEAALFFDMLGSPSLWTPGPNERHGNVMERGDDHDATDVAESPVSPWLWLSGGTDWQGFQGGFRCISEVGIQPTWLTFRVRISTPALSGAFLTFAAAQRTWGLEDIVLAFHYSGDERSHQRRCFVVQSGAVQHGGTTHPIRMQDEVVADKPYVVAVNFDWRAGVMSVFIDGVEHLHRKPFRAERPVSFAAVYNWRSGARAAFSELMLGYACPYAACSASSETAPADHTLRACCKRRLPTKARPMASTSTFTKAMRSSSKLLYASAALGVLAAVVVQQLVATGS